MPSTECMTADAPAVRRTSWSRSDIEVLFALPFADLMYRAQQVHRAYHSPNVVQLSTLLSIKTGGCPEDCAYCPQARRHHTSVEDAPMLSLEEVTAAAQSARD